MLEGIVVRCFRLVMAIGLTVGLVFPISSPGHDRQSGDRLSNNSSSHSLARIPPSMMVALTHPANARSARLPTSYMDASHAQWGARHLAGGPFNGGFNTRTQLTSGAPLRQSIRWDRQSHHR